MCSGKAGLFEENHILLNFSPIVFYICIMVLQCKRNIILIVGSSSLFRLVAHFWIFRLFMKEKFDAYVLLPLNKRVQDRIVDRSTARDFMVL